MTLNKNTSIPCCQCAVVTVKTWNVLTLSYLVDFKKNLRQALCNHVQFRLFHLVNMEQSSSVMCNLTKKIHDWLTVHNWHCENIKCTGLLLLLWFFWQTPRATMFCNASLRVCHTANFLQIKNKLAQHKNMSTACFHCTVITVKTWNVLAVSCVAHFLKFLVKQHAIMFNLGFVIWST